MQSFVMGFGTVGRMLMWIGGGAAALILFISVILICLGIAGAVFDLTTKTLARHWEKRGRTPRNKLGRIILENHNRLRQ